MVMTPMICRDPTQRISDTLMLKDRSIFSTDIRDLTQYFKLVFMEL